MVTTRSTTKLRAEITSAEKVANNEDLLIEILLRLPTKSLLKFKLVSKPWLSLISSTQFGHSHTRFLQNKRCLKPQALFLDVLYRKVPSKFKTLHLSSDTKRLPVLDFIDSPFIRIVQSCTGLLLCVSKSDDSWSYFICNPATKEARMISFPRRQVIHTDYVDVARRLGVHPPRSATTSDSAEHASVNLANSELIVKDCEHVGVNLAFDPLRSPYYKILSVWKQVLVGKDPENNTFHLFPKYYVDMYSSETKSWNRAKAEFNWRWDIQIERAVFFNGAIHWDCLASHSLYFDLDSDCLKTMPMPPASTEDRYFGASGGHLHLVIANGLCPTEFRVFEMEADYSDWFLKYRVNLDADRYAVIPRRRRHNRLRNFLLYCAVQSDEEDGESLVAVFSNANAISYNLEDGIVKRLRCSNINNARLNFGRYRACPYFETLSCI